MKKLLGCLFVCCMLAFLASISLAGMYCYLWVEEQRALSSVAEPASSEPPVSSQSSAPASEPEEEFPPEQEHSETPGYENRYIYSQLSAGQQALYRRMAETFETYGESLRITPEEEQALLGLKIFDIFGFVLDDFPEFYWVQNAVRTQTATMGDTAVYTDVQFGYVVDEQQRESYRQQIGDYERACFLALSANASDYEKIRHVYEYILSTTDYVPGSTHNQNILSVFLHGESVCGGYAKATQYLLNRLGIPCATITGTADVEGPHAWNLVRADSSWYILDTTWGEPTFTESTAPRSGVLYDYFMVTEEDAAKTHMPDAKYSLPRCTATAANYFVAENKMLYSYNAAEIQRMIAGDIAENNSMSAFRFADRASYDIAMQRLFEDGEVFGVLHGTAWGTGDGRESISYTTNDNLYIITLLL